jgi:hypothetical protein
VLRSGKSPLKNGENAGKVWEVAGKMMIIQQQWAYNWDIP